MKDTKKYIGSYIESKSLAWAPSTLKSEEARLNGVVEALDGNPRTLWNYLLHNTKPYARVTVWIRVTNFWSYLVNQGVTTTNPYKAFKEENARLFRNAYKPSKPEISYEEALTRIETIQDQAIKRRALEMVGSGLRWAESQTHSGGHVSGKGSKDRQVYVPTVPGPDFHGSYRSFLRALAKVGLKPHDLRKLFISKLVEMGANEFELMEVAGWSSIAPARSYVNVNKESLKAKVKKLQGEGK